MYEYLRLLAEALDAEELEDYNLATLVAIGVNDPKRIRKWKWSSKDKAGTQPLLNPAQSMINFAKRFMKEGEIISANNSIAGAMERARATGRPLAYMDDNGNLFDEQGNSTVKTNTTIIIPFWKLRQTQDGNPN